MPSDVSPALQQLVERLDALRERTSETLAGALAGALALDDVVDFTHFDRRNYRRNLVVQRPGYELRLLCWLPGQRTSLHGHDGAACAFRIMMGRSTEIRLGTPDNRWSVGDIVPEIGAGQVHQITNLEAEPLVSLNAYAPALPIDQPPTRYEGRHVVIIGGGVSGAALAIQLLRHAPVGLRITIVERRQWLGRGHTYGITDPAFRLDTPASRMSLFPEHPDDFVDWAHQKHGATSRGAVLPRRLFSEYVEERLAEAISESNAKVWLYRTSAISASAEGVQLADGAFLAADAVVLATGKQLPVVPDAISAELLRGDRVVGDPWTDGVLNGIARDERVLLVGTGLATVDLVHALHRQGHRGGVVAISRHGHLPPGRLAEDDLRRQPVTIDPTALPSTAHGLSSFVRLEARRLEAGGVAWQSLIDALRPHANAIWSRLPLREKARFVRRLLPYWERVREVADAHRLEELDGWRSAGLVEVLAATIASVTADANGLEIELARRDGEQRTLRVGRIILCTGPQTDVTRWRGLLFRDLLHRGEIDADPLGLGIASDDEGRVVDSSGTPSTWLSTLGSLRCDQVGETSVLPDVVRQAASLARRLLAD